MIGDNVERLHERFHKREIWRIIVPEYVACLLFLNVSNIYVNI